MSRETVETQHMSARELLLQVHHDVVEVRGELARLNGTVARHHLELFGDPVTGVPGLKPQVAETTAYLTSWRVGLRLIVGVIGLLGASTVGSLILLLAGR